jgi:hypothetical protein
MGKPSPITMWRGMPMLTKAGPMVANPGMVDFLKHFVLQVAAVPVGKVSLNRLLL